MAALTVLSSKDTIILDSLFNPEASPDQGVQIDESLPRDSSISSSTILKQIHEQELLAIRNLESQLRPQSTENRISHPSNHRVSDAVVQEALTSAIETFTSIIISHPKYSSAYANRAQCTAVQLNQSGASPLEVIQHKGLMSDLEKAITLARPHNPTAAISTANAQVLASTHTQRASIYLAGSRYLESQKLRSGRPILPNSPEKPNRPSEVDLTDDFANLAALLEEKASQEFFFGGKYGNKLAGAMMVKTNPYAKACGNVVKEATRREMEKSLRRAKPTDLPTDSP